jgi:hypothetical protein
VDKWRKGVKIRFVRTGGTASMICLVSGGSAAGFYPQALGDEIGAKEAGFPHPTGSLTRWGITPGYPPYLGGSGDSPKAQIGGVLPNSRRLSTVFRELSTALRSCGLLQGIRRTPYMGSNLRPWSASKKNVTTHLPIFGKSYFGMIGAALQPLSSQNSHYFLMRS